MPDLIDRFRSAGLDVMVFEIGSEPPPGSRIVAGSVDITDTVAGRLVDACRAHDKAKVREIGRELHEAGGLGAMQVAFRAAQRAMGREPARGLDFDWDGVGDWRA